MAITHDALTADQLAINRAVALKRLDQFQARLGNFERSGCKCVAHKRPNSAQPRQIPGKFGTHLAKHGPISREACGGRVVLAKPPLLAHLGTETSKGNTTRHFILYM